MYNELKGWFRPIDDIFTDFKQSVLDYDSKKQRRIFVDNDAKILFVAHLDTVCTPKIKLITKDRIFAPGLDDRLGCWTAYVLSRKYDADLLLTDLEESGKTTAQYHDCKDYNWVVEFDREGKDVVMYDITNDDFETALEKHWTTGFGSFSDISMLDTTACCFNLGIGYRLAHSELSYVDKAVYYRQLKKFDKFYRENKDTKFVAEKIIYDTNSVYDKFNGHNWYAKDDYRTYQYDQCDCCFNSCSDIIYTDEYKAIGISQICAQCLDDLEYGQLYDAEKCVEDMV